MSFAKVYSAQTVLLNAHLITVEVDISKGLHSFTIVGLPDKAVEESRDRVSAAIKNIGYRSPKQSNQKITISLAPADLKKEGPIFDVPMALAYLLARDEIRFDVEGKLFLGELSLDGKIRPIQGTLALVREAAALGFEEVYVPKENAAEAAFVERITVYSTDSLKKLIEHLNEKETSIPLKPEPKTKIHHSPPRETVDFGDIKGQETAKRGLLIAAAGGHNIALYGPPGTGKTMLARAFVGILPPLEMDEALEVTAIHSIAGVLGEDPLITHPPFRSPHHTSSYVALVGGGATPKPGEVTLAHRGVLFLDEFPEFERRSIDALRQPLEDRSVSISRAKGSAMFPANFILIAALNPPEGEDGTHEYRELARYRRRISGPIIDRIDMWIEVPHIPHQKLAEKRSAGESKRIRELVKSARSKQGERFKSKKNTRTNSDMDSKTIETHVPLSKEATQILNGAATTLKLSPRAYHRVIKLARTIADLEGSEDVEETHLLEALQYRPRKLPF